MKKTLFIVFVLLMAMIVTGGCVKVKNAPVSSNPDGAYYDDATIKTAITTALLQETAAALGKVNVYSYKGHVFIVGEADDTFRRVCYTKASETAGVKNVTTHWFTPNSQAGNDKALQESVIAKSGLGSAIASAKASVDVIGGHVVLTGVLPTSADVAGVLSAVKNIAGVKRVTSYIMADK